MALPLILIRRKPHQLPLFQTPHHPTHITRLDHFGRKIPPTTVDPKVKQRVIVGAINHMDRRSPPQHRNPHIQHSKMAAQNNDTPSLFQRRLHIIQPHKPGTAKQLCRRQMPA